jgi:hypothetical protein
MTRSSFRRPGVSAHLGIIVLYNSADLVRFDDKLAASLVSSLCG